MLDLVIQLVSPAASIISFATAVILLRLTKKESRD